MPGPKPQAVLRHVECVHGAREVQSTGRWVLWCLPRWSRLAVVPVIVVSHDIDISSDGRFAELLDGRPYGGGVAVQYTHRNLLYLLSTGGRPVQTRLQMPAAVAIAHLMLPIDGECKTHGRVPDLAPARYAGCIGFVLIVAPATIWLRGADQPNFAGQINVVLMTLVIVDCFPRRTAMPRGLMLGLGTAPQLTRSGTSKNEISRLAVPSCHAVFIRE